MLLNDDNNPQRTAAHCNMNKTCIDVIGYFSNTSLLQAALKDKSLSLQTVTIEGQILFTYLVIQITARAFQYARHRVTSVLPGQTAPVHQKLTIQSE